MTELSALGGLFLAAFLAATILPAQSEALLAGLIAGGAAPVMALVAVATVGNVLGSLTTWGLGLGIEHFRHRRWFPVKEEALARARRTYARWGRWTLLLSWVPFIGDPLVLVAGVMRERFYVVLPLLIVAKLGRYLVIAALVPAG
ncbi:YqaA family protein [Gimibacter soli]|uniref:DedA family protein n=1 Tax=Gimibacter soli TaxID=3024400 RepID=A0AAF0BL05_9PROT|nr:YqaA family protein [Gimibacter soli]WCL54884.1 DedA family protein [Gimibacter soli]